MQEQHLFRTEMINLIPVALGGLLAMGGGAVAQLVTHLLAVRRERTNLMRDRLESLVQALYLHAEWIQDEVDFLFVEGAGFRRVPSPLPKAVMIQELHFPELGAQMRASRSTRRVLPSSWRAR